MLSPAVLAPAPTSGRLFRGPHRSHRQYGPPSENRRQNYMEAPYGSRHESTGGGGCVCWGYRGAGGRAPRRAGGRFPFTPRGGGGPRPRKTEKGGVGGKRGDRWWA